tara:strand:- start:1116 stop:1358 length:243 start_codon:yes stop_codon:yes gene_type:complete
MQVKKSNNNKTESKTLPQYIPQKSVRNESLQSLEIYFVKESGEVDSYWLQPKEILNIPSTGVTSQLNLLQERRMIKMRDV